MEYSVVYFALGKCRDDGDDDDGDVCLLLFQPVPMILIMTCSALNTKTTKSNCYYNLTKVFIVKLWLYKYQSIC